MEEKHATCGIVDNKVFQLSQTSMIQSWNLFRSMLPADLVMQALLEGPSLILGRKTNSGDTYLVLGFGFLSSNLSRNLTARPQMVIYISTSWSLPFVCSIQDWYFASMPSEAVHLPRVTLLQICRRAGIKSMRGMHPESIRCLFSRVLPELPGLPLNKFLKGEVIHPPLIDTLAGKFSDLPQDVLMDIFALLEIPDLLRAGCVCSSWHSAHSSLLSLGLYNRPQTPCLVYTSDSSDDNIAWLYSLVEKRTYKLPLPEPHIQKRYLIGGSSHGWLVTADERSEMHIVNPITSEQIALPSVVTINHVAPIFDDTGAICNYHLTRRVTEPPFIFDLDKLRDTLYCKAYVFYDKSIGGYIVVLIHNPRQQLSFAKVGDDKWTWLSQHIYIEDCTYKDDLLYAVTSFGEVFAFDLNATVITAKIIIDRVKDSKFERIYIVQSPLGDLLQVWRLELIPEVGRNISDDHAIQSRTFVPEIYKVDTATEGLVQISSLDDYALFIGNNQTLCLCAEEYPQLKPNHVYFTDDGEGLTLRNKFCWRLDVGVINLENKSKERIVSPRLWSNCRAPVFLIPNPRKMDSASHS